MTYGAAIEWLQSRLGIKIKPAVQIVATYDYRDEGGNVLFQVCRYDPKDFRQRRPNGKGGWFWTTKGTRQVPYRLPALITAAADCVVFIVEGEKDTDRLASLGLVVTCNPGGASKRGARSKWRSGFNRYFEQRDVVIVPDNDDVGRDHARSIARNLAPVAARVRILELPRLPPKGDVSNWLDAGGTREELERLAVAAPLFTTADGVKTIADQSNSLDDAAEIARLAALPPLQCDRELPAAAKTLGCLTSTLRSAVNAARGNSEAAPGRGRPLDLSEPDPWPEPVDGAALLDELAGAIRRHVVLAQPQADAVALWVLGAHAFDAWTIFPRLLATAPERGCGKSTLLDVLSRLVPRPLGASSISPAALFRTIEAARPTLLLDEADAYARDNEELRGVVDAGHRRDGAVIRTVGDNHEPRQFSAWAPVALAAIGHLPGTIEDRSLIVSLRRRRPDEPIKPLRGDRRDRREELARKAARWAAEHCGKLREADPEMPDGIHNRAADNWRPLLAIADLAGGEWPERARQAPTELRRGGEDSESARVLLLGDLRELFDAEPSGVLFTSEILSRLHARDDRPWPEWKAGKPITGRQVAALLRGLGIPTKNTVRRGAEHAKGYRREDLDDAFARYLPCPMGDRVTTRSNPQEIDVPMGDKRVTRHPNVTPTELPKATESVACHSVTHRDPLRWRNEGAGWPQPGPDDVLWGDDE